MFTTSRYASTETRKAARGLALERDEMFISRGKRTVEQLALFARRKGEERVHIMEEKDGRPGAVSVLIVDETGGWRWEGQRIMNEERDG